MLNKIIIGTANFGNIYGIRKKIISRKKILELCNYALKKKVIYLDTSIEYKKSNTLIKCLDKKIIINTKILPNKNWEKFNFCLNQLNYIKKKLGYKRIDTIYLHDEKIIYKKYFREIYKNLLLLKKKGYFDKLGISIYNFKAIDYFLKKFKFEVLQCPFNIFDQRLISQKYYKILRSKKIKIHVRSVFLQGLLVNKPLDQLNLSKKWMNKIISLHKFAKLNNVKVLDLCMTFVTNYKIDGFVIGFDSLNNFKEVINFKRLKKVKFGQFSITNKKFIDPRFWNYEK